MIGKFSFLPNVRTPLTSEAKINGGRNRLSFSYNIKIMSGKMAQGDVIPISANLKGPGDVIGVSPQQISRLEPSKTIKSFEPNYFPFIEFIDADFPWRYSLDTGNKRKIKPWLSLIVLKIDEFEYVDQGSSILPYIRVHNISNSLPNLNESWTTAHTQVNILTDKQSILSVEEVLEDHPNQAISRLFCFRKLEADTSYHLFLVPVYETGRLAGLNKKDIVAAGDNLAWGVNETDSIELPFYYKSQFSTSTSEDLEEVLRRLKAVSNDEFSSEPLKASATYPGYYSDYPPQDTTTENQEEFSFEIQSALSTPQQGVPEYETEDVLATKMAGTLKAVIVGESDKGDDENDPLIGIKPYGFRFQEETDVNVDQAKDNKWFDRINLDLKMRLAAAEGANTVFRHQEEFSQICWQQYQEILEANTKLINLQTAKELVSRIHSKHFKKLSSEVAFVLSEPLHPYVQVEPGVILPEFLRKSGIPTAFATRGIRRISAKRIVPSYQKAIPMPRIPGDKFTPNSSSSSFPNRETIFNGLKTRVELTFSTPMLRQKQFESLTYKVIGFSSEKLITHFEETLLSLPYLKAAFSVQGLSEKEEKEINPIFRSPTISLPLSSYLTQFSKKSLLPNVSSIPDNSVVLLKENRHFIESFLVGANHAMNNELRWREFPLDMRGTIFKRFWNKKYPANDIQGDDISDISSWKKPLGENVARAEGAGSNNVVFLIRGDLIRRLGEPIIVINIAENNNGWDKGSGTNYEPTFMGRIGEDIAYYGFDLSKNTLDDKKDTAFFVIYEPPGKLRFGLDIAKAEVREERIKKNGSTYGLPMMHLKQKGVNVHRRSFKSVALPQDIASWDDLSWQHMDLTTSSQYIKFNKKIKTKLTLGDYWGRQKTSATLAMSFLQKPLAAVLPIKDVL